ncbi:hypothetical protein [Amycolatopsis echigonensis]|uniref:Uncharacterized protein n=1 Tax=Amycolatopsis echigonensis TaxID=2576905 RepID=A0A8E1W691_9PSEU|nr:hypothetical protein [Amycolatopsis echigonensis]MBB2504335.1 hypothetical protein [Amycolatopsis echigonensis]
MKRGWRNERRVSTVDTTGRPVTITTGITTNVAGQNTVVLAVDNPSVAGPSAAIPPAAGGRVIQNLQWSFDDLRKQGGA